MDIRSALARTGAFSTSKKRTRREDADENVEEESATSTEMARSVGKTEELEADNGPSSLRRRLVTESLRLRALKMARTASPHTSDAVGEGEGPDVAGSLSAAAEARCGEAESSEAVEEVEKEEELDMYWACRYGSVKSITGHLEGGASLTNPVHPRGSTPLLVASYFDRGGAVAYLLGRGADPAPRTSNQTALHLAAHRGACNAARTLLEVRGTEYSIEVDATNEEEETPLFVASYADRADMVRLLLSFGADVERPSGSNGMRPLHIAAELGCVECAKHLLERGALVDAVDASGETALYKATQADRLGSVVLLLRHGADASARVPEHGRFPLFAACERGRNLDVVAALAGNATDLDQATDSGYTSLYVAARYNLADVVRLLLHQGADPNLTNKYGETPLFAACRENHDAVVKVLLKHPNTLIYCASARWASGSPLHVAAALDHTDIAKRLLAHNADIRNVARDPASLLHVICSNGFLGGPTLNYADVDLPDSEGLAPLALALDNNHVDLARLLFVDYQAKPPVNCDDLLSESFDEHPITALTNEGANAQANRRPRVKLFNRIVRFWRRRRRDRSTSSVLGSRVATNTCLHDVDPPYDHATDLHPNLHDNSDDLDDDDEDDDNADLG